MKELTLPEKEQLESLVEEIKAVVSTYRGNISEMAVKMSHEIGEAIVESPLYKKYSKGNAKLIEEVSEHLGQSETRVRYCVQIYEKWPKLEIARKTLARGDGVLYLSDMKKALVGANLGAKKAIQRCKHCPIHCP